MSARDRPRKFARSAAARRIIPYIVGKAFGIVEREDKSIFARARRIDAFGIRIDSPIGGRPTLAAPTSRTVCRTLCHGSDRVLGAVPYREAVELDRRGKLLRGIDIVGSADLQFGHGNSLRGNRPRKGYRLRRSVRPGIIGFGGYHDIINSGIDHGARRARRYHGALIAHFHIVIGGIQFVGRQYDENIFAGIFGFVVGYRNVAAVDLNALAGDRKGELLRLRSLEVCRLFYDGGDAVMSCGRLGTRDLIVCFPCRFVRAESAVFVCIYYAATLFAGDSSDIGAVRILCIFQNGRQGVGEIRGAERPAAAVHFERRQRLVGRACDHPGKRVLGMAAAFPDKVLISFRIVEGHGKSIRARMERVCRICVPAARYAVGTGGNSAREAARAGGFNQGIRKGIAENLRDAERSSDLRPEGEGGGKAAARIGAVLIVEGKGRFLNGRRSDFECRLFGCEGFRIVEFARRGCIGFRPAVIVLLRNVQRDGVSVRIGIDLRRAALDDVIRLPRILRGFLRGELRSGIRLRIDDAEIAVIRALPARRCGGKFCFADIEGELLRRLRGIKIGRFRK